MATGIPNASAKTANSDFQITYANKATVSEILAGDRSRTFDYLPKTSEGRLYYGDNLPLLRTLLDDREVCGKVDLVYIDPPFATGCDFESRNQTHAYSDNLMGASYIEFIRKRLVVLRELLSERGSIYLHLDWRMICTAKLLLDEILGERNFRSLITRKKSNPKNYTRNSFGNIADYILFYSKGDDYIWNRQNLPLTEEHLKEYRYLDNKGRQHMRVPIHAPGVRNGETGKEWRGMLPPPGKHWQYKPSRLDELDAGGHIHWSANGNPRKKVYLDEHEGVSVQDIWVEFKDAHNQNVKITGYPTEKNPELLERIIRASSDEGSLVLDCFAGSGTTLDTAGKLGRQWIGMDCGFEAISTICRRIAHGSEKMGNFKSSELPNAIQENLPFAEKRRSFGLSVDLALYQSTRESLERPEEADVSEFARLFRLLEVNNQSKRSLKTCG